MRAVAPLALAWLLAGCSAPTLPVTAPDAADASLWSDEEWGVEGTGMLQLVGLDAGFSGSILVAHDEGRFLPLHSTPHAWIIGANLELGIPVPIFHPLDKTTMNPFIGGEPIALVDGGGDSWRLFLDGREFTMERSRLGSITTIEGRSEVDDIELFLRYDGHLWQDHRFRVTGPDGVVVDLATTLVDGGRLGDTTRHDGSVSRTAYHWPFVHEVAALSAELPPGGDSVDEDADGRLVGGRPFVFHARACVEAGGESPTLLQADSRADAATSLQAPPFGTVSRLGPASRCAVGDGATAYGDVGCRSAGATTVGLEVSAESAPLRGVSVRAIGSLVEVLGAPVKIDFDRENLVPWGPDGIPPCG